MFKKRFLIVGFILGISFFATTPFLQVASAGAIFKGVLGGGGGAVSGCTDSAASNYNSLATTNDGSCVYPPPCPDCGGSPGVPGCTDPAALNFNPLAVINNGSCTYREPPCVTCGGAPGTEGCMDPAALNFNPIAVVYNGRSCIYPSGVSTTTPITPVAPPGEYVPTACKPYIVSNIDFGKVNSPEDVRRLQLFLNRVQAEGLVVDGEYKIEDVSAVKRFQSNNPDVLRFWNLNKPTGSVFITTRKKINTAQCEYETGIKCPFFTSYQTKGDVSPEVLRIKKFLNALEGESLDLTETFDSQTDKAVKRFQTKYTPRVLIPWGLSRATGWWYQSTKKTANDLLGCFEPVRLDNGVVIE